MKKIRHLVLPVIVVLGLLCLLLGLVVPIRVAHASDTWTPTGSLNVARFNHTATLLPNGKVLIAGGVCCNLVPTLVPQASAELYDPSTGNWTTTGSMSVARDAHIATLLPNGKVLVAGGGNGAGGNTAVASAELFSLDTTAPTLSLPGTLTVNASSPLGATVTYMVSASDPDDPPGQLTISCSPASGSTFPIGTTTVNCSASDPAGNHTSGSFQVVVRDVTAPTLSLPGTVTVNASSPSGAVVTYTVTAADPDNLPSQLTISCSPASGSTFPIGTTTVTCTASDPSGNTASGGFQVVVKGAAAQVNDLISLVNGFHLAPSLQNSLDAKLQDILTALNAGQTATACSELTDFIGHVQSQTGKGLTASQANQLIAAAQQIKAVLGC